MGKKRSREVEVVRFNANGSVFIQWKEAKGESKDSHKDTLPEKAKDSFVAAVQKLTGHLYRIHEFAPGHVARLAEKTKITWVRITRNGDSGLDGECKGYRELSKNERRCKVHLGKIAESEAKEEFGKNLADICDEAMKYLDGNRVAIEGTGDLFKDKEVS